MIYHWHDLAVDEYLTYIFGCGSDDRSADVFREKIESATQMKAVIGADPRPNCLIIDEIDGAPQVSYVEYFFVLQNRTWLVGSCVNTHEWVILYDVSLTRMRGKAQPNGRPSVELNFYSPTK